MTPDRTLFVKLPDDLHKALRVRAAELGVPMSEIVRDLLEGYLAGRIELPAKEEGEN